MKSWRKFNPRATAAAILFATFITLAVPARLSAKDFVKPTAQPAKTYSAHDEHTTEKVTIAADPYDTPEKAKIFSTDFAEHGYLPVFLVITNDGDQPISIANIEIKLITANRSKLSPASADDIYRRLSNPQANTNPVPSPIPIPRKKVKGTVSPKEMEQIAAAEFVARAVEPHGTQSGFLFFDTGDIRSPLQGGHIDITHVNDAKGTELMYFEIYMDKYTN
jgi:hypothetical protein